MYYDLEKIKDKFSDIDPKEMGNLNGVISYFILARLKFLRDNFVMAPFTILDTNEREDMGAAAEKWREYLDKMISGFEVLYSTSEGVEYFPDEWEEEWEEGLRLFREYFIYLFDPGVN